MRIPALIPLGVNEALAALAARTPTNGPTEAIGKAMMTVRMSGSVIMRTGQMPRVDCVRNDPISVY